MGLLILLYPFFEFYLLAKLIEAYSFGKVLIYILFSGVFGVFIMNFVGRMALLDLQQAALSPENFDRKILHRGLVFLGGLLIFLPGVLTDILGLALILPGTRHVVAMIFARFFRNAFARGGFRVFSTGNPRPRDQRSRDAQVIDVEAIEVSHTTIQTKNQ